jgi:hypothetical protein
MNAARAQEIMVVDHVPTPQTTPNAWTFATNGAEDRQHEGATCRATLDGGSHG